MKYIFAFFLFLSLSVNASGYLLNTGDHISITVYDEADLSVKENIDRSGMISFPFLGNIKVSGKTTKQVETLIEKGLLGDYLIKPQVSVSILRYRPFFIHGEVVKPGGYPYQDDLRLDKAIALAGGLDSRASKSNWLITRVVDGKTITIDANISSIILPDDIIKIEQSFF